MTVRASLRLIADAAADLRDASCAEGCADAMLYANRVKHGALALLEQLDPEPRSATSDRRGAVVPEAPDHPVTPVVPCGKMPPNRRESPFQHAEHCLTAQACAPDETPEAAA